MLQKFIILSCFLITSISVFSQNIDLIEKKSEIPSSIYVENNTSYLTSMSFFNDLKIKNYKFLLFNDESLLRNSFMIDFRNFGRRGTKFSWQTYKDFDLHKHFPNVPDILSLDQFAINVDREIY